MKKSEEGVRVLHNQKLLVVTLVLFLVLILIVVWFVIIGSDKELGEDYFFKDNKCIKDSDCVKVQTSCCGCEMGGEEKCVLNSDKSKYLEMLSECSANVLCPAVYLCEIENCGCVDERCVGI